MKAIKPFKDHLCYQLFFWLSFNSLVPTQQVPGSNKSFNDIYVCHSNQ